MSNPCVELLRDEYLLCCPYFVKNREAGALLTVRENVPPYLLLAYPAKKIMPGHGRAWPKAVWITVDKRLMESVRQGRWPLLPAVLLDRLGMTIVRIREGGYAVVSSESLALLLTSKMETENTRLS